MQSNRTELDGQVLATLRAPTLSRVLAVMNAKRIGHHIGRFITGTGSAPTPQANGFAPPTTGASPRGRAGPSYLLDNQERLLARESYLLMSPFWLLPRGELGPQRRQQRHGRRTGPPEPRGISAGAPAISTVTLVFVRWGTWPRRGIGRWSAAAGLCGTHNPAIAVGHRRASEAASASVALRKRSRRRLRRPTGANAVVRPEPGRGDRRYSDVAICCAQHRLPKRWQGPASATNQSSPDVEIWDRRATSAPSQRVDVASSFRSGRS